MSTATYSFTGESRCVLIYGDTNSTLTEALVTGINCDYAYAIIKGKEYDMRKQESKNGMGYELTILNEDYNYNDITFVLIDRKHKNKYRIVTNA